MRREIALKEGMAQIDAIIEQALEEIRQEEDYQSSEEFESLMCIKRAIQKCKESITEDDLSPNPTPHE